MKKLTLIGLALLATSGQAMAAEVTTCTPLSNSVTSCVTTNAETGVVRQEVTTIIQASPKIEHVSVLENGVLSGAFYRHWSADGRSFSKLPISQGGNQ